MSFRIHFNITYTHSQDFSIFDLFNVLEYDVHRNQLSIQFSVVLSLHSAPFHCFSERCNKSHPRAYFSGCELSPSDAAAVAT